MENLGPHNPYASRLCVVLVDPRNPLNIGAAARAMSNFGFFDLRVVNPYDVAFREARSAVNADKVMRRARVCASVAEAVTGCDLVVGTTALGHRQPDQSLRRLEHGARLLKKHLAVSRAALLFGSEKFGLSNDDISFCHWLMRIPTRLEHELMNLGQAVALCLYELVRGGGRMQPVRHTAASSEALELIVERLNRVLRESGFTQTRTAASTERKVRQIIRRLNIAPKDAAMLHGMLRQILWRLGQEEPN